MEQRLDSVVEELKAAIRGILGDIPSQIFLDRMDRTLDEGAKDKESLTQACTKVEKMVKLFIGVDKADAISRRCREILDRKAA